MKFIIENLGIIVLILTVLLAYYIYKTKLISKEKDIEKDIDWFDSFRKKYKIELLTSVLIIGIILFYLIGKWMGVIIFLLYALIRAPFLLKEKKEAPSLFKKWWNKSYIREIYVVRARQRRLQCFIPWVGIGISLFASFWFSVAVYSEYFHPLQPYEKLKKYEGVIINYYYHKKSDDIIQIKLENGTVKNFHGILPGKNVKERYVGKKVKVLVQKDWGITDLGYFERSVCLESEVEPSVECTKKTFMEKLNNENNLTSKYFANFILSLKWLIGFLLLIWFINIKPVIITDKKQSFSPLVEILLALVGVSSLLFFSVLIMLHEAIIKN
ncbi:hypothetical protein [Arcobacter sp.]|uniref:hypothetical protein n=1 Tax=Arcobacter sp. TaxID=1872629 RepID=UPI003D0FCC65